MPRTLKTKTTDLNIKEALLSHGINHASIRVVLKEHIQQKDDLHDVRKSMLTEMEYLKEETQIGQCKILIHLLEDY